MNAVTKKQPSGNSASEQPYVQLMLRAFSQARSEQYAQSDLLQIVIWLIYRVFDINPRAYEAYLVLAYFFCLLEEWERARDILAHGVRVNPHAALQDMYQQVKNHTEQQSIKQDQNAELPQAILPTLKETLHCLEQVSPTVLKENFKRARPELNRLAGHILKDNLD